MDNFKKYIQQHADEMDTELPGAGVWDRIQQENVPATAKISSIRKRIWQYAAAACILVLITAGVMVLNKKQPANQAGVVIQNRNAVTKPGIQVQPQIGDSIEPAISPETIARVDHPSERLARRYPKRLSPQKDLIVKKKKLPADPSQSIINDVERNYAQLVNLQLQRLRVMPVYAESPDYFSTFKQQLRQIEGDEAAIKTVIRQHGLTDELLQQLININQQKLNVLKDLQAEIGKLNNKVKQSQNGADSSRSYYLNM